MKTEFSNYQKSLAAHIKKITRKDGKAQEDLTFTLAAVLIQSGITPTQYINAYNANKIMDARCFITDGARIEDYVVEEFRELVHNLSLRRPQGLGTPNAACGDWEFAALMSSPEVMISKKKNQGDLLITGKKVEFRGKDARCWSDVKGTDFNKACISISKRYPEFKPNKCTKQREGFEPWKGGQHWTSQFKAAGVKRSKAYLFEIMNAAAPGGFTEASIDRCWVDGEFDVLALCKEIIKVFWRRTEKKYDALSHIEAGTVRSIGTDADVFDKLVDTGAITPGNIKDDGKTPDGNFFRIFLANPLGWYYRFT